MCCRSSTACAISEWEQRLLEASTSFLKHIGFSQSKTRCQHACLFFFNDEYFSVNRVRLTPDQKHGTVYGRMVWRGRPKPVEEKITSSLKKEWKLLALPDYSTFKATPEELNSMIPTNTERTC